MRNLALCVIVSLTMAQNTTLFGSNGPIPLPKEIRIEGALSRQHLWEKLPERQKKLAFHLLEAGRLGRRLLVHQLHRHGLSIKHLIEESLSKNHIEGTKKILGKEGFEEFLLYSAKFMDLGGPYANSNRKYVLTKVSSQQVETLLSTYLANVDKNAKSEINRLLTDPTFELQLFPESQDGTGLELTGGNFYEKGVKGADVKAALDKTLKTTLNTRVINGKSGPETHTQTVKTPGVVGDTLKQIVACLEKAKEFSETESQKKQIDFMVRYFKEGNLEDFRKANIEWVKDGSKSPVDFMIGWVEVYEDWLARIGTWESYVQIIDPEITKIAKALASHAQYFEDGMPYGTFKKKFPSDYSPPAIMVYYFQELANYRSGGYNLPNFDDIRRDYGAKNVIRLPLPGESDDAAIKETYREMLREFIPTAKVEKTLAQREKLYRVLVLLHEIIGHGSGTYDTSKYKEGEDPISGLGNLGSALEEQRADLTALVFAGDAKLIEVGIYKNAAEAKETLHAMYDYYLADFLRRTSGQRTFTEAHQRGHLLFINALLEKGAIEWVTKEGTKPHTDQNGVLVVTDYDKFHHVAVDQLATLQKIKANRDEAGLKDLFARLAPLDDINKSWAQAIVKRGENLKINAGYVEQPWKVSSDLKFHAFGGKTLESIAPHWKGLY